MAASINIATECFCRINRMVPAGKATYLCGLFEETAEVALCEEHGCIVRVGYVVTLHAWGCGENLAAVARPEWAAQLKAHFSKRLPGVGPLRGLGEGESITIDRIAMGSRGYFSHPHSMTSSHPQAQAAHEARHEARLVSSLKAAQAQAEGTPLDPWAQALRAKFGL